MEGFKKEKQGRIHSWTRRKRTSPFGKTSPPPFDYVDLEKRVKYKDVRKRFLAKYMQEESLGEELRVFYVALTRAKEKLIMTGFCKDFEKLEVGESFGSCNLLPFQKRVNARCYLDWILSANPPLMKVDLYTAQDLMEESIESGIKEQWQKAQDEIAANRQREMEERAKNQKLEFL